MIVKSVITHLSLTINKDVCEHIATLYHEKIFARTIPQ